MKSLVERECHLHLRWAKEKCPICSSAIMMYYAPTNGQKETLDRHIRMLDEKQERAPEKDIPINFYQVFCQNVKEVLTSWGVTCCSIFFDKSRTDVEIDKLKRGSFGAGYRAIFFSGFMIGLLQHCVRNRLIHPRFVVLDSPLTTYKGPDVKADSPNVEIIPPEMQNLFYVGLADLDYLQRVQIIITNQHAPPESVRRRINYIPFTKDRNNGRYGFFPLSPEKN